VDQLPHRPASLHDHQQVVDLDWRDRHLRFHLYDPIEPSDSVEKLLAEIERDPTCIFWG